MEKYLEMFKRFRNLSNIDRCNQVPKIKFYSVAEHSYYCALLAMIFCDLIALHDNKILNKEEILKKALLHDLEESITGDILYPTHNLNVDFKKELESVRYMTVNEELFKSRCANWKPKSRGFLVLVCFSPPLKTGSRYPLLSRSTLIDSFSITIASK